MRSKLIIASRDAMSYAYCPYSKFAVGAAILCSDGSIITGCNIENAAYTVGICAERCAIAAAVSQGKRQFIAIAVSTNTPNDFASPCGACRQVLFEFNPTFDVILTKPDGSYKSISMSQLLPFAFSPDDLNSGTSKEPSE